MALSGVKDKVKEARRRRRGAARRATKATNIIESIDVGRADHVAYNQWTQFQDFSGFMKKVDNVEQEDEVKVNFKAQVFWSHRTWEATILEQVPDERIVWRSKGEKGHVDGAVTFHELAPNLTRSWSSWSTTRRVFSSAPATSGAPRAAVPGWSSSTSAGT